MSDFLPWNGPAPPSIPYIDYSTVPSDTTRESNMYKPLLDAINTVLTSSAFSMQDESAHSKDESKLRPDLVLHKVELLSRLTLRTQEVPFEIKTKTGEICNPPGYGAIEKEDGNASLIRGQLASYVAIQMSSQHRVFMFSVLIYGSFARILRWDRSGCIISEAFNYKTTQLLSEFIVRYSQLTDAQRGIDNSTVPASSEESQQLTDALKAYKIRVAPRNVDYLNPTFDPRYPTYKVTVHDSKGNIELIVRRPFSDAKSTCGRATRGYVAYHVKEQRLVFMKDYWRTDDSLTLSEAEIYERLYKADVPHLPENLAAGDVLLPNGHPQETLTQLYTSPNKPPYVTLMQSYRLRKLVHHRVAQQLAFPLSASLHSKEAVEAIHDAVECIDVAYRCGKTLHGDISARNIMIRDLSLPARPGRPVISSVGILNDWDHGIPTDSRPGPHEHRTGTWQFMSIKLLRCPGVAHEVHDDLESCFWVLVYIALHHFKHDAPDRFDLSFFSEHKCAEIKAGQPRYSLGGDGKAGVLSTARLNNITFKSKAVVQLVQNLARVFRRYTSAYLVPSMIFDERDKQAFDAEHEFVGNPVNVLNVFKTVLAIDDWLPRDWVDDRYPPLSDTELRQEEAAVDTKWIAADSKQGATASIHKRTYIDPTSHRPSNALSSNLSLYYQPHAQHASYSSRVPSSGSFSAVGHPHMYPRFPPSSLSGYTPSPSGSPKRSREDAGFEHHRGPNRKRTRTNKEILTNPRDHTGPSLPSRTVRLRNMKPRRQPPSRIDRLPARSPQSVYAADLSSIGSPSAPCEVGNTDNREQLSSSSIPSPLDVFGSPPTASTGQSHRTSQDPQRERSPKTWRSSWGSLGSFTKSSKSPKTPKSQKSPKNGQQQRPTGQCSPRSPSRLAETSSSGLFGIFGNSSRSSVQSGDSTSDRELKDSRTMFNVLKTYGRKGKARQKQA